MENLIIYNENTDQFMQVVYSFVKVKEIFDLSEIGINEEVNIGWYVKGEPFALVFAKNQEWQPFTYGEWETLRVKQAHQAIFSNIQALELGDKQGAVEELFNKLTDGMSVKYQGKKSWVAIYEDLLGTVKEIVK